MNNQKENKRQIKGKGNKCMQTNNFKTPNKQKILSKRLLSSPITSTLCITDEYHSFLHHIISCNTMQESPCFWTMVTGRQTGIFGNAWVF